MQGQQPLNTVPPIGNADGKAESGGSQITYFIKIMMFHGMQNKVATHKTFSEKKKLQIYIIMFIAYFWYSNKGFIEERPQTLYDIMDISRMADFDEIKAKKNEILQGLNNIDNETYTGNKTELEEKYNMTKSELKDMYNVLTNHHLREVYDKYNVWYNYDDFVKQKGKNIPTFEKYMQTLKGVMGLAPFLMIIYMSFTDDQPTGKTMAIVGFCLSIYIVLQIKLPNASANQLSPMIEFINEYYNHPYVVKILGSNTDKWTVHQFANYFRSVLWQVYFQFTQSFSRLVDKTPDQIIIKAIEAITNKHTKTLHIFEIMRPNRGMEKIENELSDNLKKILQYRKDEAAGLVALDEGGIVKVSGFGKIFAAVKPQCDKLDFMKYLEAPAYKKVLIGTSYKCDKCKKEIETKKGFYNCSKCKYDICLDCSGHNASIQEQEKKIADEEEAAKPKAITPEGEEATSDMKPGPFAEQVKEILADQATEVGDKDGPNEEEAKNTEDVLSDQISKEEAQGKDFDEIPPKEESKQPMDESVKLEPKQIDENIPVAEISMAEEVKQENADPSEQKLEDQDKKPEGTEASSEVAKIEGSEEKKDEDAPKPVEIAKTAKNKYEFIGDTLPPSPEKDKLMKALTSGLPETFEDEMFDWPEDVDPIYREIFDKLKKKEQRLNELSETLAKKDTELAARAQEAAPSKRIPMSDLRGEEWRRVIQDIKDKPVSPSQRLQKVAATSWGKYIIGAFEYSMELRKLGLLESMKKQIKKEKEIEKASWTKSRTAIKYMFYAWLVLAIPFFASPFAVTYYVKDQVRKGNWAPDFKINPPPAFEDDDEEDFNDAAFVEIEKDFDDEDKDEVDETSKEATDAKNSTVSEDPETKSEESASTEEEKTETIIPDSENESEQKQHVNEDL